MSRSGSKRFVRRGTSARRKPTGFAFAVNNLEERTMLSGVGGLVSDINQIDSTPTNLTDVNGKLFFVTQDGAQGTASLWATDGTTQGAVKLSSIGDDSYGLPSGSQPFVSSNGAVYFLSTDSKGAPGLFKTDGTTAGTAEVAALSDYASGLTATGGKLFFTESGPSGVELWSSDGTASGTAEVKSFGTDLLGLSSFTAVGGSVYFTAGIVGWDTSPLWVSDGTSAGTRQLTDFSIDGSAGTIASVGGKVVFSTEDDAGDYQLWTTDGTPAGTTPLTNFSDLTISPLQVVGGSVYFDAYDPNTMVGQVWTSDGTASGTVAVPATGGSPWIAGDFTAVGNTIYFVGATGSPTGGGISGQLWAINGGTAAPVTPETTWKSVPTDLTALDDSTLLFAADDGNGHGAELWKSNGTASGTTMVADLNPGPAASLSYDNGTSVGSGDSGYFPSSFAVVDGVAYFSAADGSHGHELWKSDGTPLGTTMVDDIAAGSASSSPQSLTAVDGTLYFVAHDGSGANQLWMSDGTTGGTSLVQSFTPAQTESSSPSNLSVVGGTLYFSADGRNRRQPALEK